MISMLKKEREFIVDEKDVTAVLMAVNRHLCYPGLTVGECGWKDRPTKWCVIFDATDEAYWRIVKDLLLIGKFHLEVETNGLVDTCYERIVQA